MDPASSINQEVEMEVSFLCRRIGQKQFFQVTLLLVFLVVGSSVYFSDPNSTITIQGNIRRLLEFNEVIQRAIENYTNSANSVPNATLTEYLQIHRNKSLTLGRQSRIVYNRVPKCGSRTILDLFVKMQRSNNFKLARSREWIKFNMTAKDEKSEAQRILHLKKPSLFDRHMYFFSFHKYTTNDIPFYINVVREPVSQYISQYYFFRTESVNKNKLFNKTEQKMSLDDCVAMKHPSCRGNDSYLSFIIPFFCGSQPLCGIIGKSSLKRAQSNVEKFYSVVGIMEDLPNTFKMLEYVFPQYFRGATKEYKKITSKLDVKKRFSTKKRTEPKQETMTVLRKKLKYETEFYNWIKKRFHNGLETIRLKGKTPNNK